MPLLVCMRPASLSRQNAAVYPALMFSLYPCSRMGIELRQNQRPFGGNTLTTAFSRSTLRFNDAASSGFDFPDKKWHRGQRYIRASQFQPGAVRHTSILCAWCCNQELVSPSDCPRVMPCEWATKLLKERSSVVVDCRYRCSCSPLGICKRPFVVHAGATISRFPLLLYPCCTL